MHSRLRSAGAQCLLGSFPLSSFPASLPSRLWPMRFIAHTPDMRDMRSPTPHPIFSLKTSALNDFLYAPVGEEDNGMVLTVLSALARLGVDPWDEAARLSELPKEAATKRLTLIVSRLPRGQGVQSTAAEIAARLVALLPIKQAPAGYGSATAYAKTPASTAMVTLFLVILINALVFSALRDRTPQPILQSQSTADQAAEPRAPLATAK